MISPSTCRDCKCVNKSCSWSIESWLSASSVDKPCRSAIDGRLPGDGGEERVGGIRHQQADQAGSLSAQANGRRGWLEIPARLAACRIASLGFFADPTLARLSRQGPRGRGRRNPGRLGDMLESYGSSCHPGSESGEILKKSLAQSIVHCHNNRVKRKINKELVSASQLFCAWKYHCLLA